MDRPTASRDGSFGLLAGPPTNAGAACELPVLFRVADVSVPAAPQSKPIASVAAAPPPTPVATQSSVATSTRAPSVTLGGESALATPARTQENAETLAVPPPAANPPPSDALAQALGDSSPTASEAAPATPAERRRLRDQQAPPKDDWFATHGKVIGICFLAALSATIFAARSRAPGGAKPAENAVADAPPVQMPGDHAASQAAEAPPAVALAVPTTETALPAGKPSTEGPLFPWAGDEPRTAQRSLAPELNPAAEAQPAAVTAPAAAPPAGNAATEGSPPAAAPAPAGDGAATAEQPSYPVTGYGDTFQLAPAPSGSLSTPAPSGTRNERTGSGLY